MMDIQPQMSRQIGQDEIAVAEPQKEIPREFDNLISALGALEDNLHALEERVSPVLRGEPLTTASSAEAEVRLTLLGDGLSIQAARVWRLHERVCGLLSRLEL